MKVSITIPVHNEVQRLPACIPRLQQMVGSVDGYEIAIVVAENGSSDGTLEIAQDLAVRYPFLSVNYLRHQGRGRAIKQTWLHSSADVLGYMDVDLATDLQAVRPVLQALSSGYCDIVVGTRLHVRSVTKRSWKRELVSRAYNWLVKLTCSTTFSDAQCGFKFISKAAADELLPIIKDPGWFFDTELLIVAEKCGYRIYDLPVRWTENRDSRVRVFRTAWTDLKGLARVRYGLSVGKYERFKARSILGLPR
jgi:glycosyltransferase involved in cell wall biosynthesis